MEVRLVQFLNALFPIAVRLSGMIILDSAVQPSNIRSEMVVKRFGSVISCREAHSAKAPSAIVFHSAKVLYLF
jgi:hypothetical protein